MTTQCKCKLCEFNQIVAKHVVNAEIPQSIKDSVIEGLLEAICNIGVNVDYTSYMAYAYDSGDNKQLLLQEIENKVDAIKACDRDIEAAERCADGCNSTITFAQGEGVPQETVKVVEAIKLIADEYLKHFNGCRSALKKVTESGAINAYCKFASNRESSTKAYTSAINHFNFVAE